MKKQVLTLDIMAKLDKGFTKKDQDELFRLLEKWINDKGGSLYDIDINTKTLEQFHAEENKEILEAVYETEYVDVDITEDDEYDEITGREGE